MRSLVISALFMYMIVTAQTVYAEVGTRAVLGEFKMHQKNSNFCLYDGKYYTEGSTINPSVRLGLMQCVQKPSIRLTTIDGRSKPAEYIWIPK